MVIFIITKNTKLETNSSSKLQNKDEIVYHFPDSLNGSEKNQCPLCDEYVSPAIFEEHLVSTHKIVETKLAQIQQVLSDNSSAYKGMSR